MYVVRYYEDETGQYQGQVAFDDLQKAVEAATDELLAGTDNTVVVQVDKAGNEHFISEDDLIVLAANER